MGRKPALCFASPAVYCLDTNSNKAAVEWKSGGVNWSRTRFWIYDPTEIHKRVSAAADIPL